MAPIPSRQTHTHRRRNPFSTAANADTASGVYVYDTYEKTPGWWIVGGTSVASPSLAGIVNASANRLGQAPHGGGRYLAHENTLTYSQLYAQTAYSANFYDVTTGSNGTGHNAGTGYDQCTASGARVANSGSNFCTDSLKMAVLQMGCALVAERRGARTCASREYVSVECAWVAGRGLRARAGGEH
jgi:subtilase family serine protease